MKRTSSHWLRRLTSRRLSPPRRTPRPRPQLEQLEDRAVPTISISDATIIEGNFNDPGQTTGLPNTAVFTVSLSAPSTQAVSVDFATSNGTANGVVVNRLASGLSQPTAAVTAPGDDDRLFIAEKVVGTGPTAFGRIRIYNRSTGTLQSTDAPFLTIPGVSTGGEQGLLGLTFDPNYQTNGFFYVNFTTNTAPDGVISGAAGVTIVRRYQVSATDPNIANPDSGTNLLVFAQPQTNHNAGWIEFGPDGFLYIATGDGGGANDQGVGHFEPGGNGQFITDTVPSAANPYRHEWLGKILRIDPNGGDDFPADPNRNYHNPASNPFVGVDGADEIWAFGLRNPFRNGFDRLNGDLWIGDVGQNSREEIDFQPGTSTGGENYGWRLREGTIATPSGGVGGPAPAGSIDPVIELLRTGANSAFAIIGGYVYRGPIPELQGLYIFADNVTGRIWALRPNFTGPFDGTNFTDFIRLYDRAAGVADLLVPDPVAGQIPVINNPSSFGQDSLGNLFIVDLGSGAENGQVFEIASGGDFARLSGRVTIPAGQTSVTISIQITGDRLAEGNETFFVNLSNPSGDTIADGQGQGTIVDDEPVSVTPQVESVVINDGAAQRSLVTSVTVTFTGLVNFPGDPANAFLLTGPNGPVALSVALSQDATGTRTVARLTFSGSGIVNGSLADGSYLLTVLGAGAAGGDFVFGDDPTEAFFRRYGDVNGDGLVTAEILFQADQPVPIQYGGDFGAMLDALGSRLGDPDYVDFLDANGDGVIDTGDLAQYRLDEVRSVIS